MAKSESRLRRCATYTRKSSEEGLEQDFNSLDAQREACEAYIQSQAGEGWELVRARYDDGGYSGGTLDRPGLTRLLEDIDAGKIDTVVVYKVDRLTRSLGDFAKIVEIFDAHEASFVSVTQQFNTTTSMGRLTLNMLLSFAQFEREVTGERIRDKIAASKRKGSTESCSSPRRIESEREPPNLATETKAPDRSNRTANPPSPVRMRDARIAKTPRNRVIFSAVAGAVGKSLRAGGLNGGGGSRGRTRLCGWIPVKQGKYREFAGRDIGETSGIFDTTDTRRSDK